MTNKVMTVGVLFCASLLFSGCYELLGISTGGASLDAMLSKTALPPGVSIFEIHEENDGDPSSFYVTTTVTHMTEAEIMAFYRQHFSDAGWKNDTAPADAVDGMINYSKGTESMNVTTIAMDDGIQLMVVYADTAGTAPTQ